MSITDGTSEPVNRQQSRAVDQQESQAVDQQQSDRSLLQSVREYFSALGLPVGQGLSEHATHMHHEDVPADAGRAHNGVKAQPIRIDTTRSQRHIVGSCSPERLSSEVPPTNYGAVIRKAVYRSSYPERDNFEFLEGRKLKTILTLVDKEVSPEYAAFMKKNNIQHFVVPIPANKGHVKVTSCEMSKALRIVLDRSNHPILIHCNKGKHRTGCVVGLLRRIQGYEDNEIWGEYHDYAEEKARILDECCMEYFDINTVLWMARQHAWIPPNADYVPDPISTICVVKTPA